MIEDLFCPKCGKLLRKTLQEYICPSCGFRKPVTSDLIRTLRNIILQELREEKKDIKRNYFEGVVTDVSNGIATIECKKPPKFEEGDPVGFIYGEEVIPLGIVIMPGKELTVKLERHIDEGIKLKLCDAEILIGYELQLKILDELNEYKHIKRVFFEDFNFPEIKKVRIKKSGLDDSQKEVIESILALDDGELLLVIGPPGTGKTTVICEAVKEIYKDQRILITSHTNRAVDNALERLGEEYLDVTVRVGRPEKVHPNIQKFLLSYKARTALGEWLEKINKRIAELKESLRIMYTYYKDFRVLPEFKDRLRKTKEELKELYEERNEKLREVSEKIVDKARIVGSTLIKSHLYPLDQIKFDTIFIDECSQASITLALLGIVKGNKWVVIGDPYQLLPIFRTVKDDKMLESLSSFCQLLRKYENRVLWLRTHYRSNSSIIGFSARYIYRGNIRPHQICKSKMLKVDLPGFLSGSKALVFLNVNSKEEFDINIKSYFNEIEANIVAEIVNILMKNGVKSRDIGVITPYRVQRTRIKELIGDERVEVNTVDAFQGREKSVIIYSVTATSGRTIEFAGNMNRFNVAVTRAINKLIVLGNKNAMLENKILLRFIDYAKEVKGYYDLKFVEGYGEINKSVKGELKSVKSGDYVEFYLKNGESSEGKIIEKTLNFLVVELDNIVWFIERNSIKWLRRL